MAVQVIAYELRMAHLAGEKPLDLMADWDVPFANGEDVERFFVHLEQTLTEMGFLKADAPKQTVGASAADVSAHAARYDGDPDAARYSASAQYWVRKAQ